MVAVARETRTMSMKDALNEALRIAMREDPNVILLGEDIAGGGFIANIPGDVQAIFPASMEYDGTAAAALARMLPQVPARELRVLARLDYRALWAAGQAGSGRR